MNRHIERDIGGSEHCNTAKKIWQIPQCCNKKNRYPVNSKLCLTITIHLIAIYPLDSIIYRICRSNWDEQCRWTINQAISNSQFFPNHLILMYLHILRLLVILPPGSLATNELATKWSFLATNSLIRQWIKEQGIIYICNMWLENKARKAMRCPFQWCKSHNKKETN